MKAMIEIDACGLSCPEPVIRLKKVIADNDNIRLLVDNQTSVETCSRYAQSKGFSVEASRLEDYYSLTMRKE